MTKKLLEGSQGVAEAVALCRPQVIAAYPITPQTHIPQELAEMVANGELKAEWVNVESEHSAASVVVGASAAGARVFTASSSQGILLMHEVLFNMAGMRLPIVLVCANRAISAPLNIWNDQQDSISQRDTGIIQLYAEDNQEAADLVYQAYRLAEDHRVLLPVMVCLDGYVLSHAWETIDIPSQEQVDAFLPPFKPLYRLDPDNPLSFGMYMEPDKYIETRWMIEQTMEKSMDVMHEVAHDFERVFGRSTVEVIEEYHTHDATTIIVGMGSVISTYKEVCDELRAKGEKVGVLKIVSYRPFPKEYIYHALKTCKNVVVIEKATSLGFGGPVAGELRSLFYGRTHRPAISGFIAGLGGRDITVETVKTALKKVQDHAVDSEYLDLRSNLELEGMPSPAA